MSIAVILIGLPGSGKGDNSIELSQILGAYRLGASDALKAFGAPTETKVLCDDNHLLSAYDHYVKENGIPEGTIWILDGAVRTVAQVQLIGDFLKHKGYKKLIILHLRCSLQTVLKRRELPSRKAQNRRGDTLKHFLERAEDHERNISDIMSEAERTGYHVHEVNAERSLDSVVAESLMYIIDHLPHHAAGIDLWISHSSFVMLLVSFSATADLSGSAVFLYKCSV